MFILIVEEVVDGMDITIQSTAYGPFPSRELADNYCDMIEGRTDAGFLSREILELHKPE